METSEMDHKSWSPSKKKMQGIKVHGVFLRKESKNISFYLTYDVYF